MSINTEINLLENTKEELCVAIMEKGVTVYSNDLFSTYPTRISQIPMTSGDKDNLFRTLIEKAETELTIPEGTTTIEHSRFQNVTALTSVTIPSSVKIIGYYAFNGCTSLQSITCLAITPPILSSLGTGTGNIQPFDDTNNCPIYVPDECVQLYKTAWPDYASRIQAIPVNTFALRFTPTGGGTLIEVELEDLTTSGVITRADVPSTILNGAAGTLEIGEGVTSLALVNNQGAFMGCSGITGVTISDTVTSIGDGAFYACVNLSSVALGSGLTEIREQAFRSTALTSVAIPNSVTTLGSAAFQGCTHLSDISIGNSITAIPNNAFRNCAYETITIPSSVTSIGDKAFYDESVNMNHLVIFESSTPPTLASADNFRCTGSNSVYFDLVVPVGTSSTYQGTQYYSDLTSYCYFFEYSVPYLKPQDIACEYVNGQKTGYLITQSKDYNPTSSTYGQIITDRTEDSYYCGYALPEYVLVNDAQMLLRKQNGEWGKYLIVGQGVDRCIDGSLSEIKSNTNGYAVTIDGSSIASNPTIDGKAFTINGDTGAVQNSAGGYLYNVTNTSSTNTLLSYTPGYCGYNLVPGYGGGFYLSSNGKFLYTSSTTYGRFNFTDNTSNYSKFPRLFKLM